MARLKKGSKRVPLNLKYKIQKKVKAHHRKLRRLAKKSGQHKTKKEKPLEVTIPSTWPHKAEMLKELLKDRQEAEASREGLRGEKRQKKEQAAQERLEAESSDEEIDETTKWDLDRDLPGRSRERGGIVKPDSNKLPGDDKKKKKKRKNAAERTASKGKKPSPKAKK